MKPPAWRSPAWQTVIFLDLDGTAIQGPFQTAVFPIILRDIAAAAGLPYTHVQRLVFEENARRQANPSVLAASAMDWDEIIQLVSARLGVMVRTDVRGVANAHAAPPFSWELDRASGVLRELARPGRALVAATNGLGKYQLPVLDALGLLPLFTDVLTPDRHNALKRDLAFYGPWASAAPLRISVGDNYEDDVLAPRRFGFRAVWKIHGSRLAGAVPDPFARPALFDYTQDQSERPDAIIDSLRELPEVVAGLEGRFRTP